MNDFLKEVRILDVKTLVFLWAIQDGMIKIAYHTSSIEISLNSWKDHLVPLLLSELSGNQRVG